MKNQFDSFLDGQQKAMDWWKDWSDNMSRSFGPQKTNDSLQDWWQNWFSQQQELYSRMTGNEQLEEVWKQSPTLLKDWMEAQQKFARDWTERFAKPSMSMPFTPELMEQWVKTSNEWLQKGVMERLPLSMRPHLEAFMTTYRSLHQSWEPLEKMIKFGITDKETIEKMVNPEAFKELLNAFVGMKYPFNLPELLDESNKLFEHYIEKLSDFNAVPSAVAEQWSSMMTGSAAPMYQALIDISRLVEGGLERMFHIATPSKEIAMARALKDIQFNYIAFLTRSAELQRRVYETAQFALPDTIKLLYEEYQESEELPDYNTFFQRYLNVTEDYVLEVLNSDEYAELQSKVAKLGVTVKAKMGELVELAFVDQPFLMQSYANEAAQEMSTLRRKLRKLEQRLAELEAGQDSKPPKAAPKAKATAKTTKARSTRKTTAKAGTSKDDLTSIEGIGAKISELLYGAGIETFQQLADAQVKTVKKVLEEAGSRYRMHDPTTWPEQAAMAASGQWEKLREWQANWKKN